jgi:hypothetical protein
MLLDGSAAQLHKHQAAVAVALVLGVRLQPGLPTQLVAALLLLPCCLTVTCNR